MRLYLALEGFLPLTTVSITVLLGMLVCYQYIAAIECPRGDYGTLGTLHTFIPANLKGRDYSSTFS